MLRTPVGSELLGGGLHQNRTRLGNDTAMDRQNAAAQVDHFTAYYSEIYGQGAYDEALRYALVVRSVGDQQEHDFWLKVADALHTSAPYASEAA